MLTTRSSSSTLADAYGEALGSGRGGKKVITHSNIVKIRLLWLTLSIRYACKRNGRNRTSTNHDGSLCAACVQFVCLSSAARKEI